LTSLFLPQRNARHPAWIKNYDFSYRFPPNNNWVDFTVTAVAGHLMASNFGDHLKSWQSCDPFVLFDAEILHYVNPVRRSKA
jgi:DNA topoisomerase-3